jgi:hypothetical protein
LDWIRWDLVVKIQTGQIVREKKRERERRGTAYYKVVWWHG